MTSTPPFAAANAEPATESDLAAGFRHPLPAFSPCPLWWWSGDTLEVDRLKWQLERYREGGVWNLVVINLAPAGPLYGHFADDPPFMSERWWAVFREICSHAGRLGMHIWFYDQIGFSGANIQGQLIGRRPEFAGQKIERVAAEGDGEVMVACPTDGKPLTATARPLDNSGKPVGRAEPVPVVDGIAHWRGSGRVRLSLVYSALRGFDYFSTEACNALIDTIHGEFERRAGEFLGNVIPGSFQDELPGMPRWGAGFAADFASQHGYDLLPWLDALWEETDGEEWRIRHDYHATRGALAERAFFRPLFEWHDRRGLVVGVDQQHPARAGDPIGGVRIYADYLKTHRWFSAPGSDHHGEAKVHSSLAHLYGRDRVWIESFHTSGWGGTIEETFDWLLPWLRAGATLYNPHASYYGTRGGWFEWAPPSTDWRQPYWAHYRIFADAVSRLCWLLSQGDHACDVALLYPTATMQGGLGLDDTIADAARTAHETYYTLVGRMTWYDQLTGVLDAIGIDYDIVDDDSVAAADVGEGALHIADETYRTVILPSCTVLERPSAERLLAFAESGGTVVTLGDPPSRLTGGDPDRLLSRLLARLVQSHPDNLRHRLLTGSPLVQAPVPTLVRRIDDTTVVFVPAAFPGASRVSGWPVASIEFDRAHYAREVLITVRGVMGVPELWDPFTGRRQAVDATRCHETPDGMQVELAFHGSPCAVLVWDQAATASDAPEAAVPRVMVELDNTWDVDLVPTLDNRWGDFTYPASDTGVPIEHWSFKGACGPLVATFGPRAKWIGPGQPDTLAAGGDTAPWKDAWWSLSRGIYKDPLHRHHLGPAGHVPEEFIDFGPVIAGEAVCLRTSFAVEEPEGFSGWLMIGAAAGKRLLIDGESITIDPAGNARYETAAAVRLGPGSHTVKLMLTARHDVTLRCWLALVTDVANFRRPDRLAIDGEPARETTVRFATRFAIATDVQEALIQIATRGPSRILVDNREVGRQGGYLPYGDGSATHRYDIAPQLTPGEHELAVEIDETGAPVTLVVDGVVSFGNGVPDLWLMTYPGWTVARNGVPATPVIEPRPAGDPQLAHLRQRPHPLPGSAWLEGPAADTGVVRHTTWFAESDGGTEQLRWLVPPGATSATIPVVGHATAALDGVSLGETVGVPGTPWTLPLPGSDRSRRTLEMTVATALGYVGGAVLTGPVAYTTGPGRMTTGNWEDFGLRDYSGIVRYRQEATLPESPPGGRVLLDLGHVRGSAEVRVNGTTAGTCVVAPFRVDITDLAQMATGSLTIEIDVANTLGPYLDATSPTPFVLAGQAVSGLFGPVRLLHLS